MRQGLAWVSAFAVVVGALAALAFRFGVPWAADALLGTLVLGWLLVVLTLPWDLHFQARSMLREVTRSTEAGVVHRVDPVEIRRIARRTLAIALTLHIASAGAVAPYAQLSVWPEGARS